MPNDGAPLNVADVWAVMQSTLRSLARPEVAAILDAMKQPPQAQPDASSWSDRIHQILNATEPQIHTMPLTRETPRIPEVPGPVPVGLAPRVRAATQPELMAQGFRPQRPLQPHPFTDESQPLRPSRPPRIASDAWDLGELSAAARRAASAG